MDESDTQGREGGYFYNRDGEYRGPYSREELRAQMIVGTLRPQDLVHEEDSPHWQPARLLVPPLEPEPPAAAADEPPSWRALFHSVGRRLQRDVEDPSAPVLAAFLAIGVAGLVLSRLGWILWLPWFALVLFGSTLLFLTQRSLVAVVLGLASIALPIFLLPSGHKPPEARVAVAEPAPPAPPIAAPPPPAATPPVLAPPVPESEPIAGLPQTSAPVFSEPIATAPATPAPMAAPRKSSPPPVTASTPPPTPVALPVAVAPPAETRPGTPKSDPYYTRQGSLVIVRGEEGSGSGFIGTMDGKAYLFTNNHVAAGMKHPVFTLLDGTRLVPVSIESATGHDIMRFALKEPPRQALEIATELDKKARLGDEVLVLGNSGGGGVVTSLPGKIAGIGPERLEVTAEFIPGNSGSPILDKTTGQVLGIATYLTRRRDEFGSAAAANRAEASSVVVRRFGYRLDSVTTWQPVNWLAFQAEADQIAKIALLTGDIINFLESQRRGGTPSFATDTLRRPATDWRTMLTRHQVSAIDRRKATQSFLSNLRYMVRSDVTAAEASLHYSYFRDRLHDERTTRDALYKAFDADLAAMSVPSL